MDELERNVAASQTKASRWASVSVVPQAAESADTPAQSRAKWSSIYTLFGARGETEQDEVFAAVNAYFLRNGASPAGKYSKPIRTAGGVEVEAGAVVKITGRQEGEIRQFLRGRLEDSYLFLKHNPAIRADEHLAGAAENAGMPRDYCWLLADWLGRDCPHFVGMEGEIYSKLRASKIAVAGKKREMAQPAVDRVMASAPESRVVQQPSASYNEDLF